MVILLLPSSRSYLVRKTKMNMGSVLFLVVVLCALATNFDRVLVRTSLARRNHAKFLDPQEDAIRFDILLDFARGNKLFHLSTCAKYAHHCHTFSHVIPNVCITHKKGVLWRVICVLSLIYFPTILQSAPSMGYVT